MKIRWQFGLAALFLAFAAALLQARAYDYPLTSGAIREAYLLGTGSAGLQADLYTPYSYSFHMPHTDLPGSLITIETPFLQVVERANHTPNYDAQHAAQDFLDKPAVFRVYADVYYRPLHPEDAAKIDPNQVRIDLTVTQKGKNLAPDSTDRWPLNVFHDAGTGAISLGEHVQLEFDAGKIDAAPLEIEVSTPDGQSADATFDLSSIR